MNITKTDPANLKVGDHVHFRAFSAVILALEVLEEDKYQWTCVRLRLDDGREIDCDLSDLEEVQASMLPEFG